ncbi:MAG: hypothetical protein J6S67_01015 [Methanobrevibacter sp.]|nr:hypothetical protein [Methanobrevibacter sp.]
MFTISFLVLLTLLNPFVDVTVGRCVDNAGNGKEYNGEPYYNYIKYDESEVHEDDVVVTGFILNSYGECEERLFDVVILKDAKEFEVGAN